MGVIVLVQAKFVRRVKMSKDDGNIKFSTPEKRAGTSRAVLTANICPGSSKRKLSTLLLPSENQTPKPRKLSPGIQKKTLIFEETHTMFSMSG